MTLEIDTWMVMATILFVVIAIAIDSYFEHMKNLRQFRAFHRQGYMQALEDMRQSIQNAMENDDDPSSLAHNFIWLDHINTLMNDYEILMKNRSR